MGWNIYNGKLMKRTFKTFIIIILLSMSMPVTAFSETLKVITKENVIRKENRFLSIVIIQVRYGDEMEGLGREGDWFRVKFKGKEGWIHRTAVEAKKIGLGGILGSGKTKHEEVALAGKGFNPEVEKAYRNKHPEAKYHIVDRIEAIKVSEGDIDSFIKKGKLNDIK